MVLSKDAAKARALGRDRAPASVWRRVFLASIAFPQDDPKGTSLVRGGDVSRLSVCQICLFATTSRRRKFTRNPRRRPLWGSPCNFVGNIVIGLQSRVGAEEVVTVDSSIEIGQ